MSSANAPLIETIVPVAGFAESTAEDSDATLRQRLRMDGYLFMRGLIAPQRVLSVRLRLLELCREHGWLDDAAPIGSGVARPGLVVSEPEPRYHRLYQVLIKTPWFNALSTAPELMALYLRLLEDEVFAHPRNIARIIFPGAQTTQPHQDFHYIGGAEDTYTTWVPLSDCPRDLGGLAILEGSHRLGGLQHIPAIGAGGHGLPTTGIGLRWLNCDYRCGDVVLFHSRTVHAGQDNRTGRLRLSCDFRYQRASDPVDPSSLLPHYHGANIDDV